jgi:nitronate monooxygenase/enoyl-[acyl-carrier protein] reductase II
VLRTPFCELFDLDYPILQASFGPWSSVELVAAVSEAGGLGSLGTALRPADQVAADIAAVRARTDRPFVVNHTLRPLSEEAFAVTLEARPAAVSLALGHRRELVERAHEAGVRFIQQVHTVDQAAEATESGVDVVIAQGSEAGGFGGTVGTLALVPQVVDAVGAIPVLAAGGIGDGRGLAAALVLGAQGVNVGTRFLAAAESGISPEWQQRVIGAASDEAVKVEFADHVFPPAGEGGYVTLPRVLATEFVDQWNRRRQEVPGRAGEIRDELMAAVREGRAHELVPFTGQSAGLIGEILPAAAILRRLVDEAEQALKR